MKKQSNKRKNPKIEETYLTNREVAELKNDITTTVVYGSAVTFTDIIKLLKIGRYCTDCRRSYFECKCEKCEDCDLNECMCNLNFNLETVDSNDVRIEFGI